MDQFRRLKQFLVEVWSELKKTTWPNRKEVYGTTIVVIVTVLVKGSRDHALATAERRGLRAPVLLDTGALRGQFKVDRTPTTFVLDGERTIHSVYNGWWFVGRPTGEELRQDMRAIFSQRDDWEFNPDWTAGGLTKYMGGKK